MTAVTFGTGMSMTGYPARLSARSAYSAGLPAQLQFARMRDFFVSGNSGSRPNLPPASLPQAYDRGQCPPSGRFFRHQLTGWALGSAAAAAIATKKRALANGKEPVDLLLVLGVDVSRSVNEEEGRLQREGYRAAFSDPKLQEIVQGGMLGQIAVCYVEWSDFNQQTVVVPWTLLNTRASFANFVAALDPDVNKPKSQLYTSISGVIDYSRTELFPKAPFEGTRQVIDISGDGINNSGRSPAEARNEAVAAGITVNSVPIFDRDPAAFAPTLAEEQFKEYFKENVIGGPGHFLEMAEDFTSFGGAIKRKLIREIANISPEEEKRLTEGQGRRQIVEALFARKPALA